MVREGSKLAIVKTTLWTQISEDLFICWLWVIDIVTSMLYTHNHKSGEVLVFLEKPTVYQYEKKNLDTYLYK